MEIEVTMDRRLIAQHALVVYGYEKDARYEESSCCIDHYITKHRVDGEGRLLEGTPLSREMLRRICFLVMPSLQIMEYIPDGVLAHSPGTAVLWWTQGGQRRIFFTNETGLRSGIYPLPAMLFLALNRTLYTWALTATKRPEPGTPIYHSPFFNVYEGGACCMGNIELPENASPANTHEWERAFFDGASNGHIMPKLQGIEPRKLWKTVEKKTDFPNEHLVQCGTVANVIKSAAGRPTPWT